MKYNLILVYPIEFSSCFIRVIKFEKNLQFFILHLKIDYYKYKNIFEFELGYILIDLSDEIMKI